MSDTISVVVDYALQPPQNVISPSSVEPFASHQFPLRSSDAKQSHAIFYEALKDAVREAQTTIGQELTIWRDAVDVEENAKTPKKILEDGNDDNDGDEEADE